MTQLIASGHANNPTPPPHPTLVHDGRNGRAVLFGGASDFVTYSNEVWSFDLSRGAWSDLPTSSAAGSDVPSPRFGVRMVLDGARGRFILFGGHDPLGLGLQNSTVALAIDAGGHAVFTTLVAGDPMLGTVDHTSPERRDRHGLVARGDLLWTFGGESDCAPLDDVWTMSLPAATSGWTNALAATSGETCARRATAAQTCASDCGPPQ
jgi:hypothetical protein